MPQPITTMAIAPGQKQNRLKSVDPGRAALPPKKHPSLPARDMPFNQYGTLPLRIALSVVPPPMIPMI
jgi:hypothetical protein